MTNIVPGVDPATIPTLIEANINDYLLSYARLPGAVLHADGESAWVEAGVTGATFNSVVWARFQSEHVERQIEAVLAHFRARSVPLVWHLGPMSEPADLGSALLRHGLRFAEEEPGMALDIAQMNDTIVTPPELTIEQVSDEAGLKEWMTVWLFAVPEEFHAAQFAARRTLWLERGRRMYCYLGRWNGKPVATAMLYIAKGVVAVHHVVTLPEYRRRGIGSAMTLHILRQARKRGYRVGVLTASLDGVGSYRKIGFREYCTVQRYEWDPNSLS